MPTKIKNTVLIIIDSHERYTFFNRFLSPLIELGYEPHILTAIPSIHFKARKNNYKSSLCKSAPSKHTEISNCLEYATGEIKRNLAINILNAFYHTSTEIISQHPTTLCLMWNGSRTQSRGVTLACRQMQIPTIYFELANITNKLLIDPRGTNTESKLYSTPSTLKAAKQIPQEFNNWKQRYIEENLKSHTVAQARSSKRVKFEYFLDYIFWTLGIGQRLVPFSAPLKSINTLKLKHSLTPPTEREAKRGPFLFFPLQVSTDSQIKFHSDIGNIEALKIAHKKSQEENLQLIVKIHPAETDPNFISNIINKQKELGFHITNKNTFQLIKNCKKLIVINSSIALEAIIMNKEVTFLGRSIYQNINQENLYDYISNHLINIDYFSNEEINKKTLKEIISRAE